MAETCGVEGCEKKHLARGLCRMHYSRVYRGQGVGQPASRRIIGDDMARFSSKVSVDLPGGCWLWTGAVSSGNRHAGYGYFRAGPILVLAHRWAWERCFGPVPDGLELDHLCRVRRCVNPYHLEPVTHRENCLRGERWPSLERHESG